MKRILFIVFLSLCQVIAAQDKGTIKGKLTDKEMNGESLPFANVIIKGTTIGSTTDMDGNFTISAPVGPQTVIFSFIGYQTVEKAITVSSTTPVVINQLMGASEGVSLDEIVITTKTNKESSSALLLEQKKANVIVESIGAEDLAKKGVSNAAAAVAKISGVSKQEGSSNVYVRGLGDRYLNTTLNGLTLPSNNINKKNIDLSLFSSDVIQNVSISKAYAANFYGDFAAGNIDITSKEYKGKGFLDINVGTSINTRAIGENFVKSEGTGQFGFYNRHDRNPFAVILSHGVDPVDAGTPIDLSIGISGGKSFNFKNDSRLSFFGTASFERSFEYREGPVADFINVLKTSYPNAQEYEYSTLTTVMGNVLYRIDDNNSIKYTTLFLNSASDEVGYYGFKGEGKSRDAIRNTDEGFFTANIQFNQDLILVNQLTGTHSFFDKEDEEKLKLTWGIGYNNVFAYEPDRKRITLENYQYALDDDPTTNPTFFANTDFDNQRYFQNIEDEDLNSRINFEYTASEKLTFNFGYNGRYKTREFDNIRYGYDFLTPNLEATDVNNFDNIFNTNNFSTVFDTAVFNSLENLNTTTNVPGDIENSYSGELRIAAGYASATIISPNEKFTIVPGLRLERFNQKVTYDVININPNDPGFREAKETFLLPSLNLKYALKDSQNLRLAFSKTVSTPEFKEVAPFVYEGVNERTGGNPDLLNDPSFSEVYNLDLKYEWFISSGELLSFTGFFKQINDPVNLVIANDATGTQRYFRTGDKASVYGAELEFKKNIIKNSDGDTQLSAGFNTSYTYTKQDLKSTSGLFSATFNRSSDQLQGSSPFLINTNVSYSPTNFENYKPSASLVFSYFSDRIYVLGSSSGNIVEGGVASLDFILKNKIGEKFEVNFSAKNLLDPSIERTREVIDGEDVTLSEYQRGINIALGLKYKF